MQVLICAHPWELVQAEQHLWEKDEPDIVYPAIYRCPICRKVKKEGDKEPEVILARIEDHKFVIKT